MDVTIPSLMAMHAAWKLFGVQDSIHAFLNREECETFRAPQTHKINMRMGLVPFAKAKPPQAPKDQNFWKLFRVSFNLDFKYSIVLINSGFRNER